MAALTLSQTAYTAANLNLTALSNTFSAINTALASPGTVSPQDVNVAAILTAYGGIFSSLNADLLKLKQEIITG